MKETPMMAQWQSCKEKARDSLLLFRLGDFYEAFHDDARLLSETLSLTLTKRQEIPMAGIPSISLESAIEELIQKGLKIAIAEQIEEPSKENKGILRREIVRRISPATHIATSAPHNLFFGCLAQKGKQYGAALLDLSTGEFTTLQTSSIELLFKSLARYRPKELLLSETFLHDESPHFEMLKKEFSFSFTSKPEWFFQETTAREKLMHHFGTTTLDGFGLRDLDAATLASGTLLAFIQEELHLPTAHLISLHVKSSDLTLHIDRISERNLELIESLQDKSTKGTLFETLDKCKTAMGIRLLKSWIKEPLFSKELIEMRQKALVALIAGPLSEIREALKEVRDIERLTSKVASDIASPKDLVALRESLKPLEKIKALLQRQDSSLLLLLEERILPLQEIQDLLQRALVDEPAYRISDGGVIRQKFSEELDSLRELQTDTQSWMVKYQTELREKTGIKTLKVGYTKVFGFYIETSRAQSEKVPSSFERRQTLTSCERYATVELKEYEEKLLHAEEKILRLELRLFKETKAALSPHFKTLIQNGQTLACLDALQSLATSAKEYGWNRPEIHEGSSIDIRQGRHPIIELRGQEPFVANDTFLDGDTRQLLLITGPNMAGKSTYIRQVALIVILAQLGSFVPAGSAKIGLVDKLFTRIGAHDDLARGQSTFMVEMAETANILNNATGRSLIILDEIGRGTSTYDGIAIAWAVAEYLLTAPHKIAKTLFATHFSELSRLEEQFSGAKNIAVAVHEDGGEITFLRKIVEGRSDKSYGIHVAKLAGLPLPVLKRATEILSSFEKPKSKPLPSKKQKGPEKPPASAIQLSFF